MQQRETQEARLEGGRPHCLVRLQREEGSLTHVAGIPATRKTMGPVPGAEAGLERIPGLALVLRLRRQIRNPIRRVTQLSLIGDEMSRC